MVATDEFGRHEVIHTASIVMDMFETYLLDHEAVETDPEVKEAAEKCFNDLYNFYQLVGAKWLGGDDND